MLPCLVIYLVFPFSPIYLWRICGAFTDRNQRWQLHSLWRSYQYDMHEMICESNVHWLCRRGIQLVPLHAIEIQKQLSLDLSMLRYLKIEKRVSDVLLTHGAENCCQLRALNIGSGHFTRVGLIPVVTR